MIKIKLENECFINDSYAMLIFNNEKVIGSIVGFATNKEVHIELLEIEKEYRGQKYGTTAMELFKNYCKDQGIKYLYGECPKRRINFYKRLNAKFECRAEEDRLFINNVFYIDL